MWGQTLLPIIFTIDACSNKNSLCKSACLSREHLRLRMIRSSLLELYRKEQTPVVQNDALYGNYQPLKAIRPGESLFVPLVGQSFKLLHAHTYLLCHRLFLTTAFIRGLCLLLSYKPATCHFEDSERHCPCSSKQLIWAFAFISGMRLCVQKQTSSKYKSKFIPCSDWISYEDLRLHLKELEAKLQS